MQDLAVKRTGLLSRHAVIALVALAGVVVFFLHRKVLLLAGNATEVGVVLGLSAALSLGLAWVDYRAFGDVFRRLTRLSAAGVLAYLLFEPVDMTLVAGGDAALHFLVTAGYWPAIAFAAAGVFRPSMAYFPAIYLLLGRESATAISGMGISSLDIKYMMEMAMFLGLSAGALGLLARPWSPVRLSRDDRALFEQCLAFSAIGMHLANYLWSGWGKFALGPTPWTWIVENPTASAILISLHKGISPLGQWPSLAETAYALFSFLEPVSNFAVAFLQIAAIAIVFRLVLLRAATLFYDVLHISIYVFGGLFFWPWVWNNVSVLVAVKGKKEGDISLYPRLCCVAVMLMGASTKLGDAAFLAWFDTTDLRSPKIEMRDAAADRWIEVPTSFFLTHSYAMSHGYFGMAQRPGHYFPSSGGATRNYAQFDESGGCRPPAAPRRPETAAEKAERLAMLGAFLAAHHDKMLARSDGDGRAPFYLRGHHHPSNPLLFRDFASVDLRDVDAYRYLDSSVCLSMSDGRFRERIVKRDEHVFPIDRPAP